MTEAPSGNATKLPRPRLGVLGAGWIGLHRMKAVVESATVEVVAIADPSADALAQAMRVATRAEKAATIDDLLAARLDGILIATPTAMHADQAIRALSAGIAVFCQKPLGRNAGEAAAVVAAARASNRLLAVDMSYRFTSGMQRIRELVQSGSLGKIFAVDLVFHNAYGPDKPWFYDIARAGGGCVMDLGVHLVDLALWVLDFPDVVDVSGHLIAEGEAIRPPSDRVEDYGVAALHLASGTFVQLACSWRLSAGCDAVISASFYGTHGGARLQNVDGSFYDFRADCFRGTARDTLAIPPDAWFGRAAVDWARRLAAGARFDPAAERLTDVARVIDGIYGRARASML
jgi:predicted dehydrogenase